MIKQDGNEAAASTVEPVAWQWRYIGNSVWNTQSGGAMLTAEQLVGERPIEQRPLYAAPTTSPEPDAVREQIKNLMLNNAVFANSFGTQSNARLMAKHLAEKITALITPVVKD